MIRNALLKDIGAFNLKDKGEIAFLDDETLTRVIKDPSAFKYYTFICLGSQFRQYLPFFTTFSASVAKLLRVYEHFHWSFLFLTTEDYKIKDKAILEFLS